MLRRGEADVFWWVGSNDGNGMCTRRGRRSTGSFARCRRCWIARREVRSGCPNLEDALAHPRGLTDVEASLFIGTFAFMLSTSKTFTRDLLLGSASIPKSQGGLLASTFRRLLILTIVEGNIVAEWQARLTELQSHSLATWRLQAVEQALGSIENSMNSVAASAPSAVAWAWEGTSALCFPSRCC